MHEVTQESTGKLSFGQFKQFVTQWAGDRNIIKGSTKPAQALKGFSEFGELCDNIAKGKDIKDDIGDCAVVGVVINAIGDHLTYYDGTPSQKLHVERNLQNVAEDFGYALVDSDTAFTAFEDLHAIAAYYGLDFEECLFTAWNDIKDRKGIMHNGVFIKESDPRYKELVHGN